MYLSYLGRHKLKLKRPNYGKLYNYGTDKYIILVGSQGSGF